MTITDIARRVRMSPATVSKALNGRSDVSAKTRDRVMSVARQMNYPIPSRQPAARAARVGLISFRPSAQVLFEHYPFAKLIHAIEGEIAAAGGELLLDLENHDVPRCYRNRRIHGAIVIGETHRAEELAAMKDVPIVCTPDPVLAQRAHLFEPEPYDRVEQGNQTGAALAVQWLAELGHRRIGFLCYNQHRPVFIDRADGYRQAMHRAGLEPSLATYDVHYDQCIEQMIERIDSEGWTGVVAVTDNLAANLIGRLTLRGRTVPGDLSVVGFDNWPQENLWPGLPLTTVDGHLDVVGRRAVRLLYERLRESEPNPTPMRVVVEPSLVRGKSTAACKGERL